jgi:diadenosine tetraphosphatase ApaH/serine/threonine PP2A family protein phosphatase
VRGNHDRYLIEHAAGDMHEWEADAFRQLSPQHLDWLRTLRFDAVFRDVAYLCHARPQDDGTYWLDQVTPEGNVVLRDRQEIEAWAEGIEQPLILCGHTHLPRAVRLADGRLIVNPGSVGCPAYDDDAPVYHKVEAGSPLASYAILEQTPADWSVSFRLVPYDHMTQSQLARRNRRPTWAAGLATGRLD